MDQVFLEAGIHFFRRNMAVDLVSGEKHTEVCFLHMKTLNFITTFSDYDIWLTADMLLDVIALHCYRPKVGDAKDQMIAAITGWKKK